MAKKLVYNYNFDASAQTLTVSGRHTLRTFQVVTNVTDNVIIYNFADPSKGGSVTYDAINGETVLTLTYNTTGMSDSDELQIFIDIPEDKVEFGETFTDPVSKLRVSNPENLIDTDFEYGLQPTKWETLELVNNIPSAYTRAPGVSIYGISQVNATANSEVINVFVSEEHGLSIGDPIEVRGLTSRTANGKYIITQVPNTTSFNYKASAIQSSTGNLKTAYTTIIPGSFFTGSSIEYNHFEGINTDAANPSTLTVTTDTAHGFSTNTSVYITNTVGKKELTLSNTTTSTAPDGDPYVDTTSDDVYLPLHGLYNNQVITVSAGSGGAIPATNSGPIPPTSAVTAQAAYDAAKTACETIVTTMKSSNHHSRLLMNYTGNQTRYMYNFSNITPYNGGGTIQQEIRWGASYAYYRFYNSSNSILLRYFYDPRNVGPSNLYTGNPIDMGSYFSQRIVYSGSSQYYPLTMANMGFYHVSTPYSFNQYTDFILEVRQVPTFAAINAVNTINSSTTYDIDRVYELNYEYNGYKEEFSSGTRYVYTDTTPDTYNTSWVYSWSVIYQYNGSGEVSSYTIDIWLMNTTWPDYYNDGNHTFYTGNTSDISTNNRDRMGPRWHIQALFGLDDINHTSTYANSTNAAANADAIAQAVADALTSVGLNNGDEVKVDVVDDNRIKIKTTTDGTPYDFNTAGTAPVVFTTGQTFGIADDYYNISGVSTFSASITANSRLSNRVLEFANTDVSQDATTTVYYINFPNGHGLSDGQKATYGLVSGSTIAGVTNATEYYVHAPNSKYLTLSTNESNFLSNIYTLGAPGGVGSHTLTISSISGRVAAAGTVTTSNDSKVVSGTDTKFTSAYAIGDNFILDPLASDTYGDYEVGTVASIVSDTSLTLESNAGITSTGVQHFVDTRINVRADGTFIHRPFDGGVEITAGSSPDSKVIRQTRKYFRYQSGKGIQCSMAINFNPYRPGRTLVGTDETTNATITTEYPHGLTPGDTIKVKGAELTSTINPTSATYDPTTGILVVTSNGHGIQVGEYVTIAENAFTFTCAYDNHATNHSYPRSTDPAGGLKRLEVKHVTTNTFEVNVGVSVSPATGQHNFVSAAANSITHIDTSNIYNGTHTVNASDVFTFTYTTGGAVTSGIANPEGFIEYTISNYTDAGIRAGLFDDQNGMFYEYDGSVLYCVRRSSTAQLAGTINTVKNSNTISGTNTRFLGQLSGGDYIVIRGQSYKVTRIIDDFNLEIQPKYRGTASNGVIVTKTVDLKVPQHLWSLDPSDGTGPSGYELDINAIQMVYIDYSWYGAGKIRFGFKDTKGHVKYVHEFIHNNKLNEAYMRTGNVPARYEAFNIGEPTYIPGLFHWGTSVIMDGGFDDDDSYLFTASGKSLSFTNGDADTATTNAAGELVSFGSGNQRSWYLRISFPEADAGKFSNGIPLYTSTIGGGLTGETVAFTDYSGSNFRVYIFLGTYGRSGPAVYPDVPNSVLVNIGAPAVGGDNVDLTDLIPLVSLRLAPSVDNNLIGAVGERDIINRMQLKLNEMGISVSHDARISVILNGALSNIEYDNVGSPSLSQYVSHDYGDTIQDGTTIYQFRASGGSIGANGERTVATQDFDLSRLIDMGNSVLGGDGVFPNGPDIITVCATVLDTSTVNSTAPFQVSSRISWSESQA